MKQIFKNVRQQFLNNFWLRCHLKTDNSLPCAEWQASYLARQGKRCAVAAMYDLVDGSIEQAVGQTVLIALVSGKVSQVHLGKREMAIKVSFLMP